ncbi:MerR family transcriptional regulator [Pseudonocardia humida]|uniref:MerR family transcriptional regulator n=1 Tax=Pseudonocardia humida TaxID=2800819 RepID=A0ABT0ZRY0_9PSEU|nr:MerR family transcriptional regulator [Pseudonocardia humida]MCO1653487.1 MerR family transcriptional regulator [Pseudonocardia humida]
MRWSTAEVARMSRVSSRTLRHYDHVGLLRPARTGHGGIRYYERPQLRRLQHILVLRELGMGLDDIGAVLSGETDELAALREHHARLLDEADRLRTLAATVARTIEENENGGPEMAAEELFRGFRDDPHAEEARERYGEVAVQAQQRAASWGEGVARGVAAEAEAINGELAAAMAAGTPVDDPAVQALIARHHAWVCNFWTPNREAYIGLGRLYVDDERFTANIDKAGAGLSVYLRDAIAVYAQAALS